MYLKTSKIRRATSGGVLFLSIILASTLSAFGADNPGLRTKTPVACAQLRTLRALNTELTYFTNPRTGDKLDYLVLGDAAKSDEVIVMFNGTGGILPDWPIEMITNSASSPKIVKTPAYNPAEDGAISLCHDYRMVMFDYPGVGRSQLKGNVTFDDIANDVDAILDDVATRYNISTDKVDPLGWSLGSVGALKYAFLSPMANPLRKIGNVILIATKPGGNTDGNIDGNQADCVSTIFDELKDNTDLSTSFKRMLASDQYKLTFPFVGQTPNTGLNSGCEATIEKNRVKLNVTLDCPRGSECQKNLTAQVFNRKRPPWSRTGGVNHTLFLQQRELDVDYSLCSCSTAAANFTSTGCVCSGIAPQMSSSNGGVCSTTETPPPPNAALNVPISTDCVPINITGKINVINGPEDLLIQYVYGQELVSAYQQIYGANAATIATYPGSDGAGHAVLLQHPMWTQEQIFTAMQQ